jgi:hypothetical protein
MESTTGKPSAGLIEKPILVQLTGRTLLSSLIQRYRTRTFVWRK